MIAIYTCGRVDVLLEGASMVIYFGLAGAALIMCISLLVTKFVLKPKRAQRDRGAYVTFAMITFFAAVFSFMLGIVST
jgi:hypothetical protein